MNRSLSIVTSVLSFVCLTSEAQMSIKRHTDATKNSTNVSSSEQLIYYPARDPEALIGQPLFDVLETSVWGFSTEQTTWNLDLDHPISGTSADGVSRSNLPFHVDFSSVNMWDNAATHSRQGIWSGKISCLGDFYCYGIYIEQEGRATIIPIYSRIDQSKLSEIYNSLIDVTGGFVSYPQFYHCELDSTADFQSEQNYINAQACVDNHGNQAKTIGATCLGVGAASCWWSFGAGCVGGLVCEGGLLINEYFWQDSYHNEWWRSNRCLCLESTWRKSHPGQSIPSSSCGNFSCPPMVPVSIPSLK